uniref:DUF7771 domain-containing protein n=1 Tax=Leersia perrieri TaxID=77586 RepID=A0A0D9XC73_9ORYZ
MARHRRSLAAILLLLPILTLSSNPPPSPIESYYATIENNLPAASGMDLICRALGAGFDVYTEYSVVPRGRIPRGGRRVAEILVSVVTPGAGGGGSRRVIGDLPVKRCRRHWLLFSSGCEYPDHPNPYAGRLLRNAFEFFAV